MPFRNQNRGLLNNVLHSVFIVGRALASVAIYPGECAAGQGATPGSTRRTSLGARSRGGRMASEA